MMICKSCGASNPDDALYCSGCGAKLAEQSLPLYGVDSEPAPEQPAQSEEKPVRSDEKPAQSPAESVQQTPAESYKPVNTPVFPTYGQAQPKAAPNPYAGNFTGYAGVSPLTGDASKDWAGTAGMICGIASLPCCMTAIGGLVLGICGLVFGILGLKSNKRSQAIVGIVCGSIGILLGIVMIIAVVAAMKDPTLMDEFMSGYEGTQL